MNELPIPEIALNDERGVEMLRVWVAQRQLHCSIKVGMYHDSGKVSEEKAWGILLADVARHIANAMEERNSKDAGLMLRQIANHFMKELKFPTSDLDGEFV